MINLESLRDQFPALKQKIHGKDLVYLDSAATTLKPQKVIDAITHHYSYESANVHRGVHYMAQEATLKFENTRSLTQHFLNAKHAYEIMFTSGTTESINLIASTFCQSQMKAGDEILITQMEHHSNIVPWQIACENYGLKLKVAPINQKGELIIQELENLISSKTKIISLTYISNVLGTVNPVEKIIALAREKNIRVFLDAAQAVAHLPIDVQALNVDFLAFSGHKLFGPTGVGVLYGKEELMKVLPPYKSGGDMIDKVTFEKTTFNELPSKFEAGTPNIAGVIGLGAALEFMNQLNYDELEEHENSLIDYAHQKLSKIKGLTIIGDAAEKTSVVTFTIDGIHPHDIATFLDHDGIAIRTGHHCGQPLMEFYGIESTARASLSIYNTKEEIDHLAQALLKTIEFFK